MRALRGERVAILNGWRATAQAQLWHLDQNLFARKGAAVQCASETLAALIAYHARREALSSAEEETDDREVPENENDAAMEEPDAEFAAEGTIQETFGLNGALTASASAWNTLALPWVETRTLLELLTEEVRKGLERRAVSPECLLFHEGLMHTVQGAVADSRVLKVEQELAADREEMRVTQHLAARFLANASHELRTPLTAILGFAELLMEETYGSITDPQRTAIGHIENSAQNLLEIVNNLLDMLHVRAGKLSLQYHPLVVGPLLQQIYDILIPLANRKNVAFSIELPPDLGTIEADPNILRHIVYHLLSSSLRATAAGGEVRLSAQRNAATFVICTEDTALHLPPEAIANMKDPFPRLENSPVRGYDGWEVGLPLVRRYVDLHGGELTIESQPGQGTLFRISLPVTRTAKNSG